jgi:hypothetical protein
MPERWERELRKLSGVEPNEHAIRERAGRGPSLERKPRGNALVAGVVAGAVAVAGIAALWQLDRNTDGIGNATADLPTLRVAFQSGKMIVNQPDEQIQRVDTTIDYGDARDVGFTSTIAEGAHVDWVGVEDLTRFVPGPTAGSRVRFDADGEDARVLIGRPADWPEFDRFTEIDRLPEEPGDYVLVFEATYAEGVARTARFTHIVPRGVLQLDVTEGKSLYTATGIGYLDGQRVDGFLTQSWFTLGDVEAQSGHAVPDFGSDAWLRLPSGSRVSLVQTPSEARAGLLSSAGDFDPDDPLPLDVLESAILDGPMGRQLLAVDVTWRHGPHPMREEATEERAVFFFPVEILAEQEPPPPAVTPTPDHGVPGVVTIDIRRSSEETGDPEAIARLGDQEVWMCPDGWTIVNPDGTEESIVFDCGQPDVFRAPVGTPIEVTGDFATVKATTRVSGERVPGSSDEVPVLDPGTILTLGYEVTWDDGSHASFWLLSTITRVPASEQADVLRIRCGAEGTEVLTPFVAAQPDGVHIAVENPAGAAAVEFSLSGSPGSIFGGDSGEEVWPIEPGEVFVECLEEVSDTSQGLGTAKFEVVDEGDLWAASTLECSQGDSAIEVSVHDGGAAEYVDDEATIRAMLHSVQPDDEVRPPGYPKGAGTKDLRSVVVRDGRVVAVLSVHLSDDSDPYGAGLTEVTGEACSSSGIAQGSIG